jgi:hypothetical protein
MGDTVYVLVATQCSDFKANNNFIERKLRVAATTQIYRTISKLVELSVEKWFYVASSPCKGEKQNIDRSIEHDD